MPRSKVRVKNRFSVGVKVGHLTLVEYLGKMDYHGRPRQMWRCLCDCGQETTRTSDSFYTSKTCHCGACGKDMPFSDISGQRFGMLEAIARCDHTTRAGRTLWVCRCDCGEEVEAEISNLVGGRKRSCGCARGLDLQTSAWRRVWQTYSYCDAKRGGACDLSLDDFIRLCSSPCHYCGVTPTEDYAYRDVMLRSRKSGESRQYDKNAILLRNGIDRVDNTKGHTLDNCVPCCSRCNYAKRGMTVEEFLSWVTLVHTVSKGKACK